MNEWVVYPQGNFTLILILSVELLRLESEFEVILLDKNLQCKYFTLLVKLSLM